MSCPASFINPHCSHLVTHVQIKLGPFPDCSPDNSQQLEEAYGRNDQHSFWTPGSVLPVLMPKGEAHQRHKDSCRGALRFAARQMMYQCPPWIECAPGPRNQLIKLLTDRWHLLAMAPDGTNVVLSSSVHGLVPGIPAQPHLEPLTLP